MQTYTQPEHFCLRMQREAYSGPRAQGIRETIYYYMVSSMRFADSSSCITYMYGPGSPLKALKQRAVSSMSTGPPTFAINLACSSSVCDCSGQIEKDFLQCPQRAYICPERSLQSSLESRVGQVIC